jgi:hypothetical protein
MAASSVIAISGNVSNLPLGGTLGLDQEAEQNSNSPGDSQTIGLTTTPTALTIPSGTDNILIVPPVGNTTNILIGGAGVALANMQIMAPDRPAKIPVIDSSPAMLIACATGTVSGVKVYFV